MNARKMALWTLFVLLVPAAARAAFDPQAMREKYASGAAYHMLGVTGVQLRDVDGVTGDEVLVGYPSMWHLLRWDAAEGTFRQGGFYEAGVGGVFGGGGVVTVRFARFDPAGPVEVALLGENGRIGRFVLDGTLLETWKPAVPVEIRRMVVADLDEMPGDEILLQTCSQLTAWRYGAAEPLWRIPVPDCAALHVASLDADPQPEIVLGSGYVFDAWTRAQEWRFPLAFGSTLTSGDVNGDGTLDLLGCRGRQCDAYDVLRRRNLWEVFLAYPEEIGAIAAADVDGDGKAELFAGDAQHGSIRKFSGATGEQLAEFEKMGGVNFIALGNIDGDCDLELLWGNNADSTGPDQFHVTEPVAMRTVWSSVPEERGSSGVVFADFAGTGAPSILWPSGGGTTARFVSFDPARKFSRTVGDGDGYVYAMPLVAAAQLDSDAPAEYVLPGKGLAGPIHVFDGATHRMEWALSVAPSDIITSMTSGDLTGDGVPEIVAGVSILYFPRKHPQSVVAVDGAKHTVLWRTTEELSLLLSELCLGCVVQVAVADLAGDGTPEVLALVPNDGLYAFAGRTGARLWHQPSLGEAWGFTVSDVDPSPGLEILVARYAAGKIGVYDSTGAALLREKELPAQFGAPLALQAADFDGDGEAELAVVADAGLLVASARTLDVLWSGGWVLPWLSVGNQIVIADVDSDGSTEVVVPSAHSLRVFEYRPARPDASPPLFRVPGVAAAALTGCCGISLRWEPASDTASMPVTYRVYRSTSPELVPDPSRLVAETPLETYTDRDSLARGLTYHYAVTAVDRAGNESASAMRVSATAPASCDQARRRRAVAPR